MSFHHPDTSEGVIRTSKQQPCPRDSGLRSERIFASFLFLFFSFRFFGCYPLRGFLLGCWQHTMDMFPVLFGCKWYGMVYHSSLLIVPFPSWTSLILPCVLVLFRTFTCPLPSRYFSLQPISWPKARFQGNELMWEHHHHHHHHHHRPSKQYQNTPVSLGDCCSKSAVDASPTECR